MNTNLSGQNVLHRIGLRRGLAFGSIIIVALIAFEMFNYSTTEYALSDLLGGLSFFGIKWSTILAIAFCGIDFAGIARTDIEQQSKVKNESSIYRFTLEENILLRETKVYLLNTKQQKN